MGIDVVPYRYNGTFEHTFCWEDDDQAAAHFMTLVDSNGDELLMVEVNGDCVTEVIEKGNYEMRLHHDGLSEETHPIFIQPVIEDQEAKNRATEQGTLKTVKRIIEGTFSNIGITTEARAQSVSQNINTLLNTRKCRACDLQGANLKGQNLQNVGLFQANLGEADLQNADLRGSLVGEEGTGTDLSQTNLSNAILTGANLTGADLNKSNLNGAAMNFTTLSAADLSEAILDNANMRRATLIEVTITNDFGQTSIPTNISNASLFGTILALADLTGASLVNSVLIGANMVETNLTSANLGGANLASSDLTSAILDGAIWCDSQCACGPNSIGFCAGCASVDICTGN